MKIPSGFLALSLTLLHSLAVAAGTEQNSLQIRVTNIAGKPAAGVQLWLQSNNPKTAAKQASSDATGQATFRNLAPGTYKISAFEKEVPSAAATLVDVSRQGQTTVTLGLAKMVVSSKSTNKRKHYVYVAEETGTHIGGGRWVEVEDNVAGAGANPVDKRDAATLNQPQSFQLRAYQGPSH